MGLVLPGFIATEGFPARELKARRRTRWTVSTPERVAEAIMDAGPGGRPERFVPRPYALGVLSRVLVPRIYRRIMSSSGAQVMTTATGADAASQREGS